MIPYKQKVISRHPKPSYIKNMTGATLLAAAFGGMFIMASPDSNRFKDNLENKLKGANVVNVTTDSRGTINRLWVNEGYTTDSQQYGMRIYEVLNNHSEPILGNDGLTTMTFIDLNKDGKVFGSEYDPSKARKLTEDEKRKISASIEKEYSKYN